MSETRRSEPSVLIVDDDACIRVMLSELLDQQGFAVSSASNGYTGLRLAAQEHPQVVLLDLLLPELHGLEVLRELRSRADTRDMFIIVVTGNTSRVADARLAGADLVVEKPFEVDELLAAVHAGGNSQSRLLTAEVRAAASPVLASGHGPRPRAGRRARSRRARRRDG